MNKKKYHHSLKIGDWKVYALETGKFRLDGGAMMGSVPKVLWNKTNPADEKNRIQLALRCLFLDNGKDRILIETGMGTKISEDMKAMFHVAQSENPLRDELAKINYTLEDITHVILTHLHFDHCGGATEVGSGGEIVPAFKNARYFISERNWMAAMNPNPRDRASYISENFFCFQENKNVDFLKDNQKIIDGISTLCVDGHTVGQQLVKIIGGGETLVFVADLIPVKSHLKLPWIMGYDLHAKLTLSEKSEFLRKADTGCWWLWFYHDPNSVAVKIRKSEKYYDIVQEISLNEEND